MQYSFENIHEVPAAVFYCLDPRFRQQTAEFLKGELGLENFDQYVAPSGPRVLAQEATRGIFLDMVKRVSVGLHHIKEIILIAHRDCGAYGGSKAFSNREAERATQEEDLKIAREILRKEFPELEKIALYYLEIVGDKIEFQEGR